MPSAQAWLVDSTAAPFKMDCLMLAAYAASSVALLPVWGMALLVALLPVWDVVLLVVEHWLMNQPSNTMPMMNQSTGLPFRFRSGAGAEVVEGAPFCCQVRPSQ